MIFPELKEIYSREIFTALDQYHPENEDFFELALVLVIGIKGQDGGDIFDLNVCSPKWISLLQENQKKLPNQGYLVMEKYDISNIQKAINEKLDTISGNNWIEIAEKINLFAIWEFDNYQANMG